MQQLTPSVGLSGCNMRRAWCQPSSIAFIAQIVLDIDVCALGMSIGIIYCYTGCLKASVEGGSISLGTKEYANED
ncbi:hypothetical protein S83_022166 [Arachis hypogaea]